VNLSRIELRHTDSLGQAHSLSVSPATTGETSATHREIVLTARLEHAIGGTMIDATIANRSDEPIRLDAVLFEIATGIAPGAPTRFFKHGYQSWSSSGTVDIGAAASRAHPRDGANSVTRLMHQSEPTRTAEFPEMLTSEMFTIVESPTIIERLMAGFVGAASALTTVTVPSPEKIVARTILDRVTLAPRAHRELDPLFIVASEEPAARLGARWADACGRWMNARVSAPFQRGWCSWYHYFHAITEDALRANIKALESMRSEFPIELIQLDDGFQSALGDWDTTNAQFPSGLRKIADEIRAAGFKAGLWTAPFLGARDSCLMREHPNWFIVHEQTGEPIRAGHNPNWTTSDDKFAYALDPSNPGFRAHLEHLFHKLTHEFGYSYLKLDFLYAAAASGRRHNPDWTRGETLRRGLEAIRAGAGQDGFILGCGCPLGQAVGIVDGMRIGPDVSPFWGSTASGTGDPSTVYALDAIIARSFMHRRLWLNDPDCLMLRARETHLTAAERAAMATVIAASGGMLLISDDMALLGSDEGKLFRTVAQISSKIDSNATQEPVLALDVMATGDLRGLKNENPVGAIVMFLNRGDSPTQVRISNLDLGDKELTALDLESGEKSEVFDTINLAPHSARLVRGRE
jgi:alpha-galactosidase